ncbi:MAG: PSD1 and planctomycete cytochrome C domain-containing protein [Bacteroidota bacterium]
MARFLLFALLLLFTGCRSDLPRDVARAYRDLPDQVDFNFDVQPILSDRCYACHGPDENAREADLRLDIESAAMAELPETGNRAIVPTSSGESALIKRILHDDPEELMPPPASKMALSSREQAILVKWIEQGAAYKTHWAFEAPAYPPIPDNNTTWGNNEIDAFILKRLQASNLKPAQAADQATLLRRVSLDLTGLPPTIEALDQFLADETPGAYEQAVDALIASPAYGQRWAWDWLDVARYADTNGFQGDPTRSMWPWRDWVVEAINDNMPFDQFTKEQLAGDLLPEASSQQILATAFNRNHMYNGEGGRIPEETRVENVFDRVETLGTTWLGLTVNCSRCHDHKYDPLTQQEYYQLFDYFNQTSEEGGISSGRVPPYLDMSDAANKKVTAGLKATLDKAADRVFEAELVIFPRPAGESAATSPNARGLIGENVDALRIHPGKRSGYYNGLLIKAFEESRPAYTQLLSTLQEAASAHARQLNTSLLVMVMDEIEEPRETFVLTRGGYDKPAELKAEMNVPAFLPPLPNTAPTNRLGLAEWVVSDENPLTARVTVNRIWQSFFGTGLVKTTEDFGIQGEKPSHPELLDWLALDFRDSGWDVKALHKKIVMSATYQQASHVAPSLLEADPENRLLARGPRYRLPSWMIRDVALAASGLLTEKAGGPSVKPYQPAGIWQEATFGQIKYEQDSGQDLYRRTLYTFWRRIVGPTMLFDTASRQTCSVKSPLTNTPLHALTTLNDITYVEAARVMAARVMAQAETDEARIERAYRLATARLPRAAEKDILLGRLHALRAQYKAAPEAAAKIIAAGEAPVNETFDPVEQAAFAGLCSLILNLDETLTKH